MDRKSVAILIFSILGMVIWYKSINQMYPPKPTPQTVTENQEAPSVNPTLMETAGSPGEQESNTPLTAPVGVEASTLILDMEYEGLRNKTVSLDYNFTSLGGGIESILLRDFNVTTRREEDDSTTEEKVQLNHHLEIPAMSVLFGSLEAASPMPYQLSQQGDQIMATTQTEEGLRVTKTFTPTTNYVIQASIRIENTSKQGMNVPEHYVVTGSTGPTTPEDKDLYMGLRYGYEDEVEEVKEGWFANRTLGCFPGTPRTTYASEYGPIRWASVDNQFFAMIAIPEKPAPALVTQQKALPAPSVETLQKHPNANPNPKAYLNAFVYPVTTLGANENVEYQYTLFTGPKEYNTLARLGKQTNEGVDAVMGFTGFFGVFAKGLLLAMNKLVDWGLSYGWAIVAITVIIKILFWPLTQASTRSMKRMSALQPQMKAIQDKYKEDPQKMNRKLMEFMRENKVSPLGGCLPILLQLPVFFGFYSMLQSAIELRGASFLWTSDLSQPDTLFIIPGLEIPFNLWPLLMGAAQLWQTSMTPPSPGMDPAQQKIMRYMPLMFVFILYNFSAGLALYWTVQNLLSIVQMKLIRNETAGSTPTPTDQPKTPHKGSPDWGQSYRKPNKKKNP